MTYRPPLPMVDICWKVIMILMAIVDDDDNWYYGDNLDEEVVCDTENGEEDSDGDEEDGNEGQVQALGLLCNVQPLVLVQP